MREGPKEGRRVRKMETKKRHSQKMKGLKPKRPPLNKKEARQLMQKNKLKQSLR